MSNLCEVCNDEPSVGVACVPGVPYSASYGRKCLEANAHPWGVVVGNTACLGGLKNAADWWKQIVADTCKHLNKTEAEFAAEVATSIKEMEDFENGSQSDRGTEHG